MPTVCARTWMYVRKPRPIRPPRAAGTRFGVAFFWFLFLANQEKGLGPRQGGETTAL
jgi:hypothetical protein